MILCFYKTLVMVVVIFDSSIQIAERFMELIADSNKGIKFHTALKFSEGINLLNECNPDAVLLDAKFSGNKTIELLQQIKTVNNKKAVVILFGIKDELSLEQYKMSGVDYFLDKYDDFEKVAGIIKNIPASNGA